MAMVVVEALARVLVPFLDAVVRVLAVVEAVVVVEAVATAAATFVNNTAASPKNTVAAIVNNTAAALNKILLATTFGKAVRVRWTLLHRPVQLLEFRHRTALLRADTTLHRVIALNRKLSRTIGTVEDVKKKLKYCFSCHVFILFIFGVVQISKLVMFIDGFYH